MPTTLSMFKSLWPQLTLAAILDIVIVAVVIYELLLIVRGTRAAHVLGGIFTILLIYGFSRLLGLGLLHYLLSLVMPYMAIAVIVLFQSEIRRTLARIGRRRLLGRALQRRESTEDILLAVQRLSQDRTGALIVLERDIGLRTFIESGVRMDAAVSRDLLLTVFHKDTPLHDGAVIIQKERLAAAACFLPLSMNPAISAKLGTRHRAAIGITEETDCLAIIVSEETGRVSLAAGGDLESDLAPEELGQRIAQHFSDDGVRHGKRQPEGTGAHVPKAAEVPKASQP